MSDELSDERLAFGMANWTSLDHKEIVRRVNTYLDLAASHARLVEALDDLIAICEIQPQFEVIGSDCWGSMEIARAVLADAKKVQEVQSGR